MFALIFGGVFSLCGLTGLLLAWRTFAKDRAIRRWPRTVGRVTASRVESWTSRSKDQQGFPVEQTMYEPKVSFTYEADGRTHEGTQLARASVASSTPPDLSPYPVGGVVMVYVNPEDPTIAYLEVHRSVGAMIIGGMGALFLAIGLLVPTLVLWP